MSVILYPHLKVTLREIADFAFHGRCASLMDITAVPAVPFHGSLLIEDLILFKICEQFCISSFIECLHLDNLPEEIGNVFSSSSATFGNTGYSIPHSIFSPRAAPLRLSLVVPIDPAGYAAVISTSPPFSCLKNSLGCSFSSSDVC
jgi:hypothetical protein